MLLNAVGKKITEENVKKVITASGAKADNARIKALVSALEGVKIEEVIKQSTIPVAPVPVARKEEKIEEKKGKKPEEGKKVEEAASGLATLFG